MKNLKKQNAFNETCCPDEKLNQQKNAMKNAIMSGKVKSSEIKAYLRTVFTEKGEIWFCEGKPYQYIESENRYKKISSQNLQQYICGFLEEISEEALNVISKNKIREAIDTLSLSPKLQIELNNQQKSTENKINCLNGVVKIMDGHAKLLEHHDPEVSKDNFNYCIQAKYIENVKYSPVFDEYCKSIFGDDYMKPRAQILEIIGYTLSGFPSAKVANVFIGESNSGKSVLLKFVEQLFGPDAKNEKLISSISLHDMEKKYMAAEACIAKANIVSEISIKAVRDICAFKEITSGDSMTIEDRSGKIINVQPSVKLLFASNLLPQLIDTDIANAFIERFNVVIFPNSVPKDEKDIHLGEKLWAERDNIYSMAMDALARLEKAKFQFILTPQAWHYLNEYKYKANSFRLFWKTHIYENKERKISIKALFKAYYTFCDNNRLTKMKDSDCYETLELLNVVKKKMRFDGEKAPCYGIDGYAFDVNAMCAQIAYDFYWAKLNDEMAPYEAAIFNDDIEKLAYTMAEEKYNSCIKKEGLCE